MKATSITILKLQALGLHPYQYALRATPTTEDGRCVECDEIVECDVCRNPECSRGHGACALCERVQPMRALHTAPDALPQDLFCETCLGRSAETPAA